MAGQFLILIPYTLSCCIVYKIPFSKYIYHLGENSFDSCVSSTIRTDVILVKDTSSHYLAPGSADI